MPQISGRNPTKYVLDREEGGYESFRPDEKRSGVQQPIAPILELNEIDAQAVKNYELNE